MLIQTITDFVKIIPTAAGTEYDTIYPFLEEAENKLISLLLGTELYEAIEAMDDSETPKRRLKVLLALEAYSMAIPFVDLVQTPNGFAVVSNSNQAPASKERVDRLIAWVNNQILDHTDLLISIIYNSNLLMNLWSTFEGFEQQTNCLILNGNEFEHFVKVKGNKRQAFLDAKQKLLLWQQTVIAPIISVDYFEELLLEMRTKTLNNESLKVIKFCKIIFAALLAEDKDQTVKLCNQLSTILDKNLLVYTTYASSAEYALRNTAAYENKQEDKTFFMGV